MSSKLPSISGQQAAKAFGKIGYAQKSGGGKGSHLKLVRLDPKAILIIPNHSSLKRGMLCKLIRNSGLSVDEFIALLR